MSVQIKPAIGVTRTLTVATLTGITRAAVVMVTKAMGSYAKVRSLQKM